MPSDALTRSTRVYRENMDPFIPSRDLITSSAYSPGFLFAIDKALEFDAANRPQNVASFRKLLTSEILLPETCIYNEHTVLADNDATVLVDNPYPVRVDHASSNDTFSQNNKDTLHSAAMTQSVVQNAVVPGEVELVEEESAANPGAAAKIWRSRGLISGVVLGAISAYFFAYYLKLEDFTF